MTEPTIRAPWIDPLALYDGMVRLGLYHQQREIMLYATIDAATSPSHMLARNASRDRWLEALERSVIFDGRPSFVQSEWPIVTFVLDWSDTARRLFWRPLRLNELPLWLTRLRAASYDPTEPGMRAAAAHARVEVRSVGSSNVERDRKRNELFTTLMAAARYPQPSIAPSVEDSVFRARCTPEGFVGVFRAYTSTALSILRGGCVVTDASANRQRWRAQRGHGAKPAPRFFGKDVTDCEADDTTLFAGVELEMELDNELQRNVMSAALFYAADSLRGLGGAVSNEERLHIEYDGSLNEWGIEAVLRPHEIGSAHGEAFWRATWDAATSNGASDAGMKAGMHIHVNAGYALKPPPARFIEGEAWRDVLGRVYRPDFDTFSETIGFFIDLVTGVLAGGPEMLCCKPVGSQPARPDPLIAQLTAQREGFASPRGEPIERLLESRRLGISVFQLEEQYASGERARPNTASPPVPFNPTRWPAVTRQGSSTIAYYPNSARFLTAFGRSPSWSNHFAHAEYSLARKETHAQRMDRYRAINWLNEETIEFRLWGPHGFIRALDWINVATQMTAAIVAYAQHEAGRWFSLLARDTPEHIDLLMPSWLRTFLDLTETSQQNSSMASAVRVGEHAHYAMTRLTVRSEMYWLPGWPINSNLIIAPTLCSRRKHADIYLATVELWARFIAWLELNSPRFDLALVYLRTALVPQLPTLADLEAVRGRPVPASLNERAPRADVDAVRTHVITGRTAAFLLES